LQQSVEAYWDEYGFSASNPQSAGAQETHRFHGIPPQQIAKTMSIHVDANKGDRLKLKHGFLQKFGPLVFRNEDYPIQYDNSGIPYVTIESQWGNNDEHTLWLDDTWARLGYDSIGEYMAHATSFKNPNDQRHMGD
jgi:hypothetical protein